jgi:hypothetical protein
LYEALEEQLTGFDSSGMGYSSDLIRDSSAGYGLEDMEIDRDDPQIGAPGVRIVRKLSLEYIRTRLVEHFDILFKNGRIQWPSRT